MSIVDSLRKLSLKLTGAYSSGEDIEDNIEYIAENYSGGGGSGEPSGVLTATIVESLPENGVEDKLYLVLSDSEEHIYNEYIWSNDVWVDLGPIHVEIDVEEITELKEDLTLKADLPTETIENVSIASFTDGAEDVPVKELKVGIEPIRDLHGYDNPWPAGGGKNLFGGEYNVKFNLHIPANTAFTVTAKKASGSIRIDYYDQSDTLIDWYGLTSGESRDYRTITSTVDVHSVKFSGTETTEYMVEIGSSMTDYAPYSNLCPISGRDSVTVYRTVKNLLRLFIDGYVPSISSGALVSADGARSDYIPIDSSTSYALSIAQTNKTIYVFWYGADKSYISYSNGSNSVVATSPNNAKFAMVRISGITSLSQISNAQFEKGTSVTSYDAPTTYPIPLSSTVYGGTLEVETGVLTVDRAMVDLGSLTWEKSGQYNRFQAPLTQAKTFPELYTKPDVSRLVCSNYATVGGEAGYSGENDYGVSGSYWNGANYLQVNDLEKFQTMDATQFKTAMSGVMLCYELATPTTVQLTPAQVTTLLKDNNIFADSGNIVKLIYRADLGAYIEKLINA